MTAPDAGVGTGTRPSAPGVPALALATATSVLTSAGHADDVVRAFGPQREGAGRPHADRLPAVDGPPTVRIQEGHRTVLHVICDPVESARVAAEPPASR